MRRPLTLIVGALTGYLGLSYEILWVRVFSFVTGGTPASFGVLLGAYLIGLACGSLASWAWCSDRSAADDGDSWRVTAKIILLATVIAWLLIPWIAFLVRRATFRPSLFAVAAVAGLLGSVLPLLSHLGIPPDDRAGARLSYLYLANIIGSAFGSLLTGFFLLDKLSLAEVSELLALVGVGLAVALVLASRPRRSRFLFWILGEVFVLAAILLFTAPLFAHVYEKLQFKASYQPGKTFAHVVENRHGVITVQSNGTVFGGGVYDGVFNTNLIADENLIIRAYALSAIHPRPRQVLMVGLSSGSWAQVIAHNPYVERLTVVEINPGYLKLIPKFPGVASLLQNPKVEIFIDDGRRWLVSHKDRKFDAVVNNVTWHWRSQATNLLSAEYLELVKQHLTPGGVLFYNTTFSLDAQKTACSSFRYGFRLVNCMAVSDQPVDFDRERLREVLAHYQIDGRAIFDLSRADHRNRFEEVLKLGPSPDRPEGGRNRWFQPCASILKWGINNRIVTDDNMATEWYRPWSETPD